MTVKLIAHLHVEDFDAFKAVFDQVQTLREEHGAIGHRLHRGLDDPNKVIVVTEYRDADEARRFAQSTHLKEAQERAGVVGRDFTLTEVVEDVTY